MWTPIAQMLIDKYMYMYLLYWATSLLAISQIFVQAILAALTDSYHIPTAILDHGTRARKAESSTVVA